MSTIIEVDNSPREMTPDLFIDITASTFTPRKRSDGYTWVEFDETLTSQMEDRCRLRLMSSPSQEAPLERLQTTIGTLDACAASTAAASTNWPTMTASQKDEALQALLEQFGHLANSLKDLLVYLNLEKK